ncbi:hypothetical protein [Micromonospora antibiotica]|uniref:Uncharacterized protein n=1 Tax=Micromonospora antibiotica TaxID=2807623 RepID=A0ABS3VA31_9ACTN|nr:hypothetical protein [Micromonospora antibiotica]MBO4162476.1 hypothetical protein [Micromonospora antibiotica]
MQTVGPYALHRKLSSCELGEVWAARDTAERPFTVAVLAPAAAEGGWREAFAAAANTLARSDGLPITGANHTGPVPWVACAAEQGAGAAHVFLALGQRLVPAGEPPAGVGSQRPGPPGATAPVSPAAGAAPVTGPPAGRADGGATGSPVDGSRTATAVAASAGPVTDGTATPAGVPRSAGPTSPAARPAPQPPAPPRTTPQQGVPAGQRAALVPYPQPPVAPRPAPAGYPGAYPSGAARGRGRTGWWLALVALVAVGATAIGAAGGFGVARWSADDPTTVAATAAPTPSVDLGLPGTPPRQPGVEPPVGGGWPTGAPTFAATDPTREITGLAGVDFSFRVPTGWSCTEAGRTSGSAHYRCGVPAADGSIIGGDLVVRQCPRLCTDERRTALRRQEEAWGLQWVRSGEFTTWAETARVDGASRYGLVYLSYWRSVPEDAIDRQLVLRMTAPLDRADEVRKVAASVREATFTI